MKEKHTPIFSVIGCGVILAAACAGPMESGVTPSGEAAPGTVAAIESGAGALQSQDPVQQLRVHLVGFHPLKHEPMSQMTAHHFCHVLTQDMAQCVLFDGNTADANLNGIEYIISEQLYQTLPDEERPYWHPHNYEILSGTLIAPGLPDAVEHAVLKRFINSYGKTWHTWSTGLFQLPADTIPLGAAQLAWSFNHEGEARPGLIEQRDETMRVSSGEKREQRRDLAALAHPQAGSDALLAHPVPPNSDVTALREEAAHDSEDEPQQFLGQARRGIEAAIRQAERSLGPHQPGSGHTKLHMQRVVNQLEGVEGLGFEPLPGEPAQPDGAVLPYLRQLRSVLGERGASGELLQAVEQTMQYVDAAVDHARRAAAGTSVREVHEQAGLATGLVIAARGVEDAASPVTGALSYVERHLNSDTPPRTAGHR